jgi:hypothetical protein
MKSAETACRDMANKQYKKIFGLEIVNDDICLLSYLFFAVYFMALYLISSLDVPDVKVPDAHSVVRHTDTRVPARRV